MWVLDALNDIYDRGHDMKRLYAYLLEHFRKLLVATLSSKLDRLNYLPHAEIELLTIQAKQASAISTVLMPKSSTSKLNMIGRHLCRQSTGVN